MKVQITYKTLIKYIKEWNGLLTFDKQIDFLKKHSKFFILIIGANYHSVEVKMQYKHVLTYEELVRYKMKPLMFDGELEYCDLIVKLLKYIKLKHEVNL